MRERLGAGGAGDVLLAEQLGLGRDAVLKVLIRTGEDEKAAADRFLREARLASTLDHPFAAHVYGFGREADGTLWIAMERVRGTPLNRVLEEQGPIALARFVPFFERLCEVVHAAHEQGIIHRDIKPANVMVLSRAGKLMPKLLDLGIARRMGGPEAAADSAPAGSAATGAVELDRTYSENAEALARAETLDITRVGAVVGTPLYMAPEQWVDASHVDARADVYSLALLAYHALSGRAPFTGANVRALARAHGTAPLPPLPDEVPAAVHAALARGAAKRADERPATAIELAAALRAAAQLHEEPQALPQLDEMVRSNAIVAAPQPIAEAVARVEAARSLRQVQEAFRALLATTVRYVGVLGLASRARVGPGAAADEAAVTQLLVKLASAGLTTAEWWALSTGLAAPFAQRPGAHPLPEVVAALTAAGASSPQAVVAGLLAREAPDAAAPDADVHAFLRWQAAQLSALLNGLSFLYDYTLAVRLEGVERFMGARRAGRVAVDVVSGDCAPREAVLVDQSGVAVLSLRPFLQVFTPGAGLADELFLVEGPGRHGARMVALPAAYERHSDEVWPFVERHIAPVSAGQEAAQQAEKPPYKGLSTFTAEDADNYFGREVEAETFANRLRSTALLAVVGPSGAGKSSFILAGVLPLLPDTWRSLVSRPGNQPFAALAARLSAAGLRDTAAAVLACVQSPAAVDAVPAALVREVPDGQSLLVVVDQFEELVTLCADAAQREAFAHLLVALGAHPAGRVRVVLTLRDDFLIRVQRLEALRGTLSSALQLLSTPARDDLVRVVEEPARRAGYRFDDAGLVGRMVDEVVEHPGALALLSFTASQLWDLRDRALKQLRAKTYDALGGVGGALAQHAEATLALFDDAGQRMVREAFRHLVTSQGTRAVLSRRELGEVLANPGWPPVLERLVTARLLMTSEDASGDDRVELVHEALLVSWPRLVGWQKEDADTARVRDALRAAARQWEERGRPGGMLWRAETLAEYRLWRPRFQGRLTAAEQAFADASLAEERRGQRVRLAAVTAVITGLLVGLGFAVRGYVQAREAEQKAQDAAKLARDSTLSLLEEQGRLALLDERPLDALTYLAEAAKGGADTEALHRMGGLVAWKLRGDQGEVLRRNTPIRLFHRLPDGRLLIAIGPNQLSLITTDGEQVWQRPRFGTVLAVVDSERFVVPSETGVDVVSFRDGRVERHFDLGEAKVVSVHAVPTRALAADEAGLVWSMELKSGRATKVAQVSNLNSVEVVMSPSARRGLVLAGDFLDSPTLLKGLHVLTFDGLPARVLVRDSTLTQAAFLDDDRVVAGTQSGEVGVISLKSGGWLWRQSVGGASVACLRVAPDSRLFTLCSERVYGAMEAEAGAWVFKGESRAAVFGLCFDPSTQVAAAFDSAGSVHSFSLTRGDARWTFVGHAGMVLDCIAPDDRLLFTSSADGSLRRWDLSTAPQSSLSDFRTYRALAATAVDDGAYVADAEGLWHVSRGATPSRITALTVGTPASMDSSPSGVVALWEQTTVHWFEGGPDGLLRPGGTWETNEPATELRLSRDGSRVALGHRDGSVHFVETRTGKPLGIARVDGRALHPGLFLGNDVNFACSERGAVFEVDVVTGATRARDSAHTLDCWTMEVGQQAASFSLDGKVAPLDGRGAPVQLPSGVSAVSDQGGAALLLSGHWVAFGQLPLGQVTIPGFEVEQSEFSQGTAWFRDSYGRVGAFAPPPPVSTAELIALHERRGTTQLVDSRLVPRR